MLTASDCVKFGFSVQTSYPLMRSLHIYLQNNQIHQLNYRALFMN